MHEIEDLHSDRAFLQAFFFFATTILQYVRVQLTHLHIKMNTIFKNDNTNDKRRFRLSVYLL